MRYFLLYHRAYRKAELYHSIHLRRFSVLNPGALKISTAISLVDSSKRIIASIRKSSKSIRTVRGTWGREILEL